MLLHLKEWHDAWRMVGDEYPEKARYHAMTTRYDTVCVIRLLLDDDQWHAAGATVERGMDH